MDKLLLLAKVVGELKNQVKVLKDNPPEIHNFVGEKGDKGTNGKNGLDGKDGLNGKDGKDGKNGKDGEQGVSVVNANIELDGSLVLELSNGNEIDVGEVVGRDGTNGINGLQGANGIGVPVGGTTGQVLSKIDSSDYNTQWVTVSGGGGTETDPIFIASPSFGITSTNITNWNTAYGWGNHASAGYLTSGAIGVSVQAYDANLTSWAAITPSSKQDTLISNTNIKTINSTSILGSGNIVTGTVTSVSALTLGTTGTDLTSTVATGTTTPIITLNVPTASAANRGALSSTDWSTFNGKQAALGYTPVNKAGDTMTGQFILAAGAAGANTAPIEFQSGTLQTTAEAGAMEYDGTAFYSSIAASTRGAVPTEQIIVLTGTNTLTSQTAVQPIFDGGGGTTNGAVTLPVGTYQFECSFALTGMSATSGSFGFALAGTATKTQGWQAQAGKGTGLTTVMATSQTWNTAANTVIAISGTGTTGIALIKGTMRVTVAGTIIPQVSLTVASAAIIQANSYFKVSPIGNATVATVGNWS